MSRFWQFTAARRTFCHPSEHTFINALSGFDDDDMFTTVRHGSELVFNNVLSLLKTSPKECLKGLNLFLIVCFINPDKIYNSFGYFITALTEKTSAKLTFSLWSICSFSFFLSQNNSKHIRCPRWNAGFKFRTKLLFCGWLPWFVYRCNIRQLPLNNILYKWIT